MEKGRRLTGKESDAQFNKIWTHLNTNGRLPVTYNWTDQPKTFGAGRKFRLNTLSENNTECGEDTFQTVTEKYSNEMRSL